MLGGPHVSHLTNTIKRIVGFYYKDGDNRSDRQFCVLELFLLVEFSYKGGPYEYYVYASLLFTRSTRSIRSTTVDVLLY